ncbi:hypothetical protein C8035_v000961 [Colletotrichum spinosum]|uniref:Uncharacterized protein n=1 Tax=Colletotrichum spinosum TaxID=1347390 RepID=A0A4R8QD14_9PEZI|nr:hypothetical protein C8035_v000961 [Colletotrichum spinosum]
MFLQKTMNMALQILLSTSSPSFDQPEYHGIAQSSSNKPTKTLEARSLSSPPPPPLPPKLPAVDASMQGFSNVENSGSFLGQRVQNQPEPGGGWALLDVSGRKASWSADESDSLQPCLERDLGVLVSKPVTYYRPLKDALALRNLRGPTLLHQKTEPVDDYPRPSKDLREPKSLPVTNLGKELDVPAPTVAKNQFGSKNQKTVIFPEGPDGEKLLQSSSPSIRQQHPVNIKPSNPGYMAEAPTQNGGSCHLRRMNLEPGAKTSSGVHMEGTEESDNQEIHPQVRAIQEKGVDRTRKTARTSTTTTTGCDQINGPSNDLQGLQKKRISHAWSTTTNLHLNRQFEEQMSTSTGSMSTPHLQRSEPRRLIQECLTADTPALYRTGVRTKLPARWLRAHFTQKTHNQASSIPINGHRLMAAPMDAGQESNPKRRATVKAATKYSAANSLTGENPEHSRAKKSVTSLTSTFTSPTTGKGMETSDCHSLNNILSLNTPKTEVLSSGSRMAATLRSGPPLGRDGYAVPANSSKSCPGATVRVKLQKAPFPTGQSKGTRTMLGLENIKTQMAFLEGRKYEKSMETEARGEVRRTTCLLVSKVGGDISNPVTWKSPGTTTTKDQPQPQVLAVRRRIKADLLPRQAKSAGPRADMKLSNQAQTMKDRSEDGDIGSHSRRDKWTEQAREYLTQGKHLAISLIQLYWEVTWPWFVPTSPFRQRLEAKESTWTDVVRFGSALIGGFLILVAGTQIVHGMAWIIRMMQITLGSD